MKELNVTLEFKGKETLEHVYELHIKNLTQAVATAAGDESLLRQYELDLMGQLELIRKLQYQAKAVRS